MNNIGHSTGSTIRIILNRILICYTAWVIFTFVTDCIVSRLTTGCICTYTQRCTQCTVRTCSCCACCTCRPLGIHCNRPIIIRRQILYSYTICICSTRTISLGIPSIELVCTICECICTQFFILVIRMNNIGHSTGSTIRIILNRVLVCLTCRTVCVFRISINTRPFCIQHNISM